MSDVHHFKGTVNAGVLRWISNVNSVSPIPANPTNSGVYVFRLSDLPNYTELSNLYEFIRVNRCRMEFMPRFNMTNIPVGTTFATETTAPRLPTFITGVDEVPLVSTIGLDIATSSSWVSQGGDSSVVNEMSAYQAIGTVGPDYIRGLKGSKETEIYKKHVINFMPIFFDYTMSNQPIGGGGQNYPQANLGIFEKKQKRWLNCSFILQTTNTTSSENESVGPDFYGPAYSFSTAATITSAGNTTVELYDVKMHYSISTRRYKGVTGNV